ncbi:MAG: hypothetical protein ACLPN1_14580 [Dissulfurispiraceae bacterium]|jgi:hypothetical protein
MELIEEEGADIITYNIDRRNPDAFSTFLSAIRALLLDVSPAPDYHQNPPMQKNDDYLNNLILSGHL